MAKKNITSFVQQVKKKRKGIHSKNAYKGQNGYKKKSKGQGGDTLKKMILTILKRWTRLFLIF